MKKKIEKKRVFGSIGIVLSMVISTRSGNRVGEL